jgi:hypothetical protein
MRFVAKDVGITGIEVKDDAIFVDHNALESGVKQTAITHFVIGKDAFLLCQASFKLSDPLFEKADIIW